MKFSWYRFRSYSYLVIYTQGSDTWKMLQLNQKLRTVYSWLHYIVGQIVIPLHIYLICVSCCKIKDYFSCYLTFLITRNIKNLNILSFSFSLHASSLTLSYLFSNCKKPNKNHGKLSDSVAFKLKKCIKMIMNSLLL